MFQNKEQNNGLNLKIIPTNIDECEKMINDMFGKSYDIVSQRFNTNQKEAMILFIDGLTNRNLIDRDIMYPLKDKSFDGDIGLAIKTVYKDVTAFDEVIKQLLEGFVILFYDKSDKAYSMELRQFDKRCVSSPEAETVIRGPREGFTESIQTNSSMIRRKLKNSKLVIESMTLGRQTNTLIGIVYIDGIVNQEVLTELKKRLAKINIDSVLETAQIEQLIIDKPMSTITGIGLTQKPDVVAARILEGRVAVLCDGTPHVLTIPELFQETMQAVVDYTSRTFYSSFIRILRLLALSLNIFLPGLAVAFIDYNPEMIPPNFLITFISATELTPMPDVAEVFFLMLMFELLKEAGLRMPKSIGSAVAIVGALIIGDTAVMANIVTAPIVIIIALTSVAGLVVPNLNEFCTLFRFTFFFLGASFGLIGISAGIIIMMTYAISRETFGIPFFSSISKEDKKDTILRFPISTMKYRPKVLVKENVKRIDMEEK